MGPMRAAIREAKHPVALTGAGISAPSGVPTFQTQWKGKPVRGFLERRYLEADPVGFFELFCAMERWRHATPNDAHRALAAEGVSVITQNIDGLHQKAGTARVIELHGNLRTVRCPACGKARDAAAFCEGLRPLYDAGNLDGAAGYIRCACGGRYDTEVVLYEDAVQGLEEAVDWLMEADLLLVIGTSLETYPAAALPGIARERGVRLLMEDRDCLSALSL